MGMRAFNLAEDGPDNDAACNICGSKTFGHMRNRRFVRCASCKSLERTRLLYQFICDRVRLTPQSRIAHFAPEVALGRRLMALTRHIDFFDYAPELFKGLDAIRFDLCNDLHLLEDEYYDLIVHSHVIEHLYCNYTVVLQELQKKLKRGGLHVFAVPIMRGGYRENTTQGLTEEQRIQEFGQDDHVRLFGSGDLQAHLGAVFDLSACGTPLKVFGENTLRRLCVPQSQWDVYSGSTIFWVEKV